MALDGIKLYPYLVQNDSGVTQWESLAFSLADSNYN